MDAELLEYLETAIRDAKNHLTELPPEVETAMAQYGCVQVDFAHDTLEAALTRIERAKVLG